MTIVMMMETVAGGGETNSFRNNKNVEYKKGMAFNMSKPSDSETITPKMGPTVDEVYNSTLMKDARKEIIRIGEIKSIPMIMIHANTLHLSKIVQDLNLRMRISAWYFSRPHKINISLSSRKVFMRGVMR